VSAGECESVELLRSRESGSGMLEYDVVRGFLKMMYFLLEIMETNSEWRAKLNTCANRNINISA
jgi:hypothetical protein